MGNINAKRVMIIFVVAIGVFYISLQSYRPLLHFLMLPLTESIASGVHVPLAEATALGENFRIAFKLASFTTAVAVILLISIGIGFSFIIGLCISYVMVRYGLFDLWNNDATFSMEKYVNHLMLFMLFVGAVFSGIFYKIKKGNKNA